MTSMTDLMRVGLVVLLCAVSGSLRASDTTRQCEPVGLSLRYEAYIAGVNAGQARLEVGQTGSGYRVAGTARSKGLWESMQQWRAEYSVEGELVAPAQGAESDQAQPLLPAPGHFYSLQTTPRKRREIHIEDGVLKETKNHKVRDPRPAQSGYDLLSALFFLPACHPSARIHTGRDGYEFTRKATPTSTDDAVCRYEVVDEDGGRYGLGLRYRRIIDFNIPAEINVRGPLPGRMLLVESTPLPPHGPCD